MAPERPGHQSGNRCELYDSFRTSRRSNQLRGCREQLRTYDRQRSATLTVRPVSPQPGGIDSSFVTGVGANNWVNIVQRWQHHGRLLLGGLFTTFNGISRPYVAALNPDGTLDTSFNPGTGPNGPLVAMAVQPDNTVLVGGFFTSVGGVTRNRIARLNANGTLDQSFDVGTGAGAKVSAIALQPDGRILVGGEFTNFNGTTINRLVRLNTDGSL